MINPKRSKQEDFYADHFWFRLILCGTIYLLNSSDLWCAPLGLNQVTQSAIKNYPTIQMAIKDVARSQADALGARGGFDPVLKVEASRSPIGYYKNATLDASVEQPTSLWGTRLTGGYRLGQGDFASYDGKLATFDAGEARVGVEIPLLRNGPIDERRAKIATTQNGLAMANAAFTGQQIEIERLSTLRYWDWLAAGKKLMIAQGMLKIAEERDEALSSRLKHGDLSTFERKDNLRTIIQRKSAIVSAERSLQKAALELSLFFRNEEGAPIVAQSKDLPSDFPAISATQEIQPDSLIKELPNFIDRNPEVKRTQANLEQFEVDLKVSQNQILPKLDLKFGFHSDLGISNVPKFLIPTEYPNEAKLSIAFELPLFFRSAQGRFAAASANLEKLNTQLRLQTDRIRTNITDTDQIITQSVKRVAFAKQELALAKELEEGERTRFFHGDSNLLFVNIREQNTREAALREIDSILEYFRAKAEYKAATAEPIQESN